jgi:hydrogenase/urease accessory protein HupE
VHPTRAGERSLRVLAAFRTFALTLLVVSTLRGHDPGLSTTQVVLGKDSVEATVGFAPNDVRPLLPKAANSIPSSLSQVDFDALRPGLETLAGSLIEVRDDEGVMPWAGRSVSLASGNSITFHLGTNRFPIGHVSVRSLVMDRLPPGHRDYVSISGEDGRLLAEKLVGLGDGAVIVPIAPAPPAGIQAPAPADEPQQPTFWGFLSLGIAHIWTGYDHLLFLFGLLVVCRSFRSIVGIISCFTVAHSITLALATLNVVNLPSGVVEPMIAASIFYVGVENLVRKGAEPRGRWALTFGFGLIHGFGFASVLRGLGIGSNGHGLAMPLFTFNLGVEIGQISIAALVLPVVWKLRKNPGFVRRGVPVLSALVAAAGLYWFLERTVFQ